MANKGGKTISISRRAQAMPASPIRKLYLFADSLRQRGISILHLNIGQPDLPTPRVFFNTQKQFAQKVLAYAPSQGCPEAIAAWRTYYKSVGIHFSKTEIVVTTGGSEAIMFALTSVADPGDEVLVFEPLYPNYISFAQMSGIVIRPVPLRIGNGFHLPDEKEITGKISRRTKAIIICNPSNPTGTVFSKKELLVIARIALKHNLFIIADDAYREFIFDHRKYFSLTAYPKIRNRLILVDSASKRFNVCGARVGCVASTNREVMAAIFKFAQGRLSSPTIDQLAVVPMLKKAKTLTDRYRKEYQKRRDVLLAELKKIPGVGYSVPEGAFYVIVGLPVADAEHFCQWLVEHFHYKKETIMLAPAAGFYINQHLGTNQVRIAYVLDSRKLRRAMIILREGLVAYNKVPK